MAYWVELRVHGVSGTPPESMLASAHVKQVAGDERSRIFRPTDAQGTEVRPAPDHLLEAFHWGRWTSGSWTQALWILLIPFGIVNAAQFMLPAPAASAPSRAWHAAAAAVLRLLALALTVLFAVAASVVVIDLVGWQWLARTDLPGDVRVVLVPAVVVAVGVVYLLSRLGRVRAGRRRYGSDAAPAGLPGLGDTAFFDGDPDNPSLRHLHLAAATFLIGWLAFSVAAAADTAFGLGRWLALGGLGLTVVVVAFLGDPERTTSVAGGTGRVRRWWHGLTAEGRAQEEDPPAEHVARALHGLGLAAVLGGAAAIAFSPVGRGGGLPSPSRGLPGIEWTAAGAGIGGAACVVLLLLAVALLARTTRAEARAVPVPFRRFAAGMTAWLAAAIGFFLAIGLTAGLALTVQGLLNRLPVTDGAVRAPDVLQRVSFTWGVAAVLILGLGLAAWWELRRRRKAFVAAAAAAYTFGVGPVGERPRLPREVLRRVARAMQLARLKNHLQLVFWLFATAGTVLAAAAVVDYLVEATTEHATGWFLSVVDVFTGTSSLPGQPISGDDIVIGAGQLVLLGLAGGAALLARGAIRAEGARRGLNVVWDVVAFWPRSAHPFVPPPYAQEVVPALVRRICWLLGVPDPLPDGAAEHPNASAAARNPEPASTVVVAAHSQGSLISLAALLQLPAALQARVQLDSPVRWLTFGSQLRQQFPRAFPHYVRVADLEVVAGRHHWLSLYRDTDPIAGPVTSWRHRCTEEGGRFAWSSRRLLPPQGPAADAIDPRSGRRECGREWRLLDPPATDWRFQTGAVATIEGHSNYWLDPDWADALAAVLASVRSTAGLSDEPTDDEPDQPLAAAQE